MPNTTARWLLKRAMPRLGSNPNIVSVYAGVEPWKFISSTARTNCSATTTLCRPRGIATAVRWRRCAACSPRFCGMIQGGATHIAVATDQVIESFRNGLWSGYKTGEGVEPELLAQFPLLEETLSAAGVVSGPWWSSRPTTLWRQRRRGRDRDARVDRVIVCTPDKDLAQCVRGERVVQLNRRTRVTFDEAAVIRKFGVPPESIPDYLALVGDSADGYPGLPGWGAKSTAGVLAKFGRIERIPADPREWKVDVGNAATLAATLSRERDLAFLFRTLATLRTDIDLFNDLDQLQWNGPTPAFEAIGARIDAAITETKRPAARPRGVKERPSPDTRVIAED